MSLITPDDLALKLRATVDREQAQQACDLASGVVQSVTGQTLIRSEHVATVPVEFATLPRITWPAGHVVASWQTIVGRVPLHERPVSDVTNVATFGADLAADGWWWDGVSAEVWLADPETPTATVTYVAGWNPIPEPVRSAALAIAAAEYANPSGLRGETIGDYSVQFGGAQGGPGIDAAVAKILARYTVRADSITPA